MLLKTKSEQDLIFLSTNAHSSVEKY